MSDATHWGFGTRHSALGGAALGVLVMTSLLAVTAPRLEGQISPGPLARVHGDLESAEKCTKCHGLRREPLAQGCLTCHRDIAWLIDRGEGFHAREANAARNGCASCHPDHAGRDFALIAWPGGSPAKFNHDQAGWPLELSHRNVKCESCHKREFRSSPAAALSERKADAGWVGLQTTCVSCHRADDPHKGALGGKCESCHDAGDWKRATRFDHETARYALTGKHASVVCDKCHLSPRLPLQRDPKGALIPVYRPLAFRECSDCHEDPHKGQMSGSCSRCHDTRGFAAAGDRKDFNHALTRFPLAGKHARVRCAACHGLNLGKPRPAFSTCASCHADPHDGRASLGSSPVDCASCHRVEGFAPATYTIAQHRSAPFVLEGRHLTVQCAACHTTTSRAGAGGAGAKLVRIRMPYAHCGDCHADAHGGQLGERSAACEGCHVVGGWSPSTFAAAAHARLRLPLEGRHARIACAACHSTTHPGLAPLPTGRPLGSAGIAVRPDAECGSCHVDPHAGRYSAGGAAAALAGAGCRSCHTAQAWRPSSVDFDAHARFSFALEGAHRAVPCVACHNEMKGPPASATLVRAAAGVAHLPFAVARTRTCESCHDSPHGTQFETRRGGAACATCHSTDAFVPASKFDHDRDAAFKLAGAHAQVACARCHRSVASSIGGSRVLYRPLGTKCEDCHTARPPESSRTERSRGNGAPHGTLRLSGVTR